MTRPTRRQFADLDFGEDDSSRVGAAKVIGLPLPDDPSDAASKRYVDGEAGSLALDVARIKTALFLFFDIDVDELEPLPEFLS